jgi:hypothetical protein
MANVIENAGHPILNGPAGVVRVYDASQNLTNFFGGMVSLGPQAHAVLSTSTRRVVAVIEPNELGPGSGPVILVSEANGFQDPPVGSIIQADNLALLRNIFAYASGMGPLCRDDAECDDGRFCNGEESCSNGRCVPGSFPCPPGEGCQEGADQCGPCQNNVECDDLLFCNGMEVCSGGLCQAGVRPCPASKGCHEEDDTCGACRDNGECDDGLYCNGPEYCETGAAGGAGECKAGPAPCVVACEACDEATQSCKNCIFDLDADGFIGTGDFGIFAGCFGACYPPDHFCQAANFDGSQDGCVGTGDFGAFSGCFGGACENCETCDGPEESVNDALSAVSGTEVGAMLELVAVSKPTKLETADQLPTSVNGGQVGDELFVELWAGRGKPGQNKLAAVYTDLGYDPRMVNVMDVTPSASFGLFAGGSNNTATGTVESLGGCAMLSDAQEGPAPAWVKVVTLRIQLAYDGASIITTSSAGNTYGISTIGEFGNLNPVLVSFGRLYLATANDGAVITRPEYDVAPRLRK